MMIFNSRLVEQQGLTSSDISELEELHKRMQILKDMSIDDVTDVKKYVETLQNLEFEMQAVWKFSQDTNYHVHWFLDPKCSCPKRDNIELQGVKHRIINKSCRLHGGAE